MPVQQLSYGQFYKNLQGITAITDKVARQNAQNAGMPGFAGTSIAANNSASVVTDMNSGANYVTYVNSAAAFSAQVEEAPVVTPQAVSPDPPTNPIASVMDSESVSIEFTAPVNTGGSPITMYTATSSPGGITGSSSSSPITVMGLTTGTAYTFTVRATNAAGTSVASSATSSFTPPGNQHAPPTNVRVIETYSNSVVLLFTPPEYDELFGITSYTAISSPGGITASIPRSSYIEYGTTSHLPVTGLTPQTTYTFTVVATNDAGNSVPSSPSSPITTPQTILPGPPTNPVVSQYFSRSISVAFTPPAAVSGNPITSYIATSSPGGITGTATSSPVPVTGLTPGTSYTFTIRGVTAEGNTTPSTASSSITVLADGTLPDQIVSSLTTNLAAYNSANTDQWIRITSAEYNNLYTNVKESIKAGISDAYLASPSTPIATSPNVVSHLTMRPTSGIYPPNNTNTNKTIPANNYVYAFAVNWISATPSRDAFVFTNIIRHDGNGVYKLLSYQYEGQYIPSISSQGVSYFVRKSVSSQVPLSGLYPSSSSVYNLGFFTGKGIAGTTGNVGIKTQTDLQAAGETNIPVIMTEDLNSSDETMIDFIRGTYEPDRASDRFSVIGNGAVCIQALVTGLKQWS